MAIDREPGLSDDDLGASIRKLIGWCGSSEWAGYDPYDALDSPVFNALPFSDRRLPRLALTQALKRSPISFRRVLGIRKTRNPKALALFLSAFVRLSRGGFLLGQPLIDRMIESLIGLRSPDDRYWNWGFPFPWQGRTFGIPARAPNLVCTAFVAAGLLDGFEQNGDPRCLDMAHSAARYLVDQLYWAGDDGKAGFSYPEPSRRSTIHNANLLAGALLCRVHTHTGDAALLQPALAAARFAAGRQRADGSWPYGESAAQQWCDNFHTGYNLCALRVIARETGTAEFDACTGRGFAYYRTAFVRPDGRVSYYPGVTYPVDSHCVAQSIITLAAFAHLDPDSPALARLVYRWAMAHLWDERGFFYYRKLRFWTTRTPYMRWSQAWMLLAMSTLLPERTGAATPMGRAAMAAASA